jgi:trigger factor
MMEPNTNIQMESLSDIKRKLQIVVPSAEVTAEFNRVYKDLGKRVKVKGFRPGKVPRSVLEMYYKKQVQEEVSDALVRRSLGDALKEQSLEAVGFNWPEPLPPVVLGEDFRYQVEVEVPPDFTAHDYRGLKLEDPGLEISDDQVESRLEEIRQSNAMLEPLKESRDVQEGDFVVLDYQGFFAGEALSEAKAENSYLEVGAGKFNLDFEKNLIGLAPLQESRFAVELPANFFNPLLAGKLIDFQVKVQEVKEKVVPELDDAFAQSLGGNFQILADLREAIRDDIIKSKERERQGRLEEQALDQLIAAHPFEAPPSLIRQEQEGILRDQVQFMQSQGLNMQGMDMEKMLEHMKPKAERRVRVRLIFDKIAAQENVALEGGDLEEGLARIAERSHRSAAQVRQFYEENHLMEGLRRQLRDEKVMELIVAAAELVPGGSAPDQEKS